MKAGDAAALALLGLLGVALFSFCLTAGVAMSSASSASLLTNSQPIFTTLLAPLIIDEKLTPRRLAGALLGLGGVALIVTGGRLSAALLRQEYFLGNLVLTGGAVAISVQTILLKRFVIRFGGLLPTFLTMLAGSLFLAAAVLATGGWRELGALSPAGWLLAVYIGLAGTALVYPLFNAALRGYGVVRSVGFKMLIPVFGILLSLAPAGRAADLAHPGGGGRGDRSRPAAPAGSRRRSSPRSAFAVSIVTAAAAFFSAGGIDFFQEALP